MSLCPTAPSQRIRAGAQGFNNLAGHVFAITARVDLKLPWDVMSKFTDRARIVHAEFYDGWVLEIDGDIQSHVDLDDPGLIRFEYLRRIGNVLDVCWPPAQPIRILHLGAGALTLTRYVQATRPGSRQTVIELDPELVTFVTSQLPLPHGTDLQVLIGDARAELKKVAGRFDAIIVDIFTGSDTATHLSHDGFYREILQRLTNRGVLLVNIGDDDGLEFFSHQARALHRVAVHAGWDGAWTLADATTLEQRLAGNAVLATGPALPTGRHKAAALRSQLAAAGPYPVNVLTPGETMGLVENIGR